MPVIALESVSKSYRGRTLYTDVTMQIDEGGVYAVEGPNGSGKSVLFRMLCGFTAPDRGTVRIDPRYLDPKRSFPSEFGVIIDRPGYLPGRTGLDNLRELAAIRGLITDDRIRDTMTLLGLDPDLKQRVRHYSLGMKQKLAIAQALMEAPRVLILDEPFNALDVDSVANLKTVLRELNDDGVTIVFTSHNPEDVADLASTRLRIQNERIALATAPTM